MSLALAHENKKQIPSVRNPVMVFIVLIIHYSPQIRILWPRNMQSRFENIKCRMKKELRSHQIVIMRQKSHTRSRDSPLGPDK